MSLIAQFVGVVRPLLCLVGAHEWITLREPTRMREQCLHCCRQTTGIEIGGRALDVRFTGTTGRVRSSYMLEAFRHRKTGTGR